jgi:hypothetical protein
MGILAFPAGWTVSCDKLGEMSNGEPALPYVFAFSLVKERLPRFMAYFQETMAKPCRWTYKPLTTEVARNFSRAVRGPLRAL